ncbi:hypothetical protein PRUPE_1G336900 [Prunus persica]|uniref:Uncharacterized protein n=1 Tax=Prunus persica TaxID=3760 RepID=A0A251R739_PRUPE|nr:hypothetical protein PRUPE_1G336900 [Prunus persica]
MHIGISSHVPQPLKIPQCPLLPICPYSHKAYDSAAYAQLTCAHLTVGVEVESFPMQQRQEAAVHVSP